MSISPEEMFQLHYPLEKWKKKRELYEKFGKMNARERRRKINCVYEIRLKELSHQKNIWTLKPQEHSITWNTGSYGVSMNNYISQDSLKFHHERVFLKRNGTYYQRKSQFITLNEIYKEQAGDLNLIFMSRLSNSKGFSSQESDYLDKMTLKCGVEGQGMKQEIH